MCSPFSCFSRNLQHRDSDHSDSVKASVNNHSSKPSHPKDTLSIEKHLKMEKKMADTKIRVLLLGPGSSGKTTILKQIKKIHCNDELSELSDRQKIAKYVRDSVIDYMKILCAKSVELHEQLKEDTLVKDENEALRVEFAAFESPYELTSDVAYKIKQLWTDNGIRNTLKLRKYFQIHENVAYFFDRIDEVSKTAYLPTFDDFLRFRQRSTGFSQTTISMKVSNFGDYMFEFTDVGGQRSERSKWMRFISEDINAVLYILAIGDYDLTLFEDNQTNRLKESLDLFREIMVKGNFFKNKSVLLFFNKYDLFTEKIKKIPITVALEDFPVNEMDPHDPDDAVRFLAGKFLAVFQEESVKLTGPLHIVRTTALDTDNIEKIFGDITLDLVQTNLQNLYLL